MPVPTEEEKDLVWKNYEEAFRALVDAVVGRKSPRYHHDEQVYALARDLASIFRLGRRSKNIARNLTAQLHCLFVPLSVRACLPGRIASPFMRRY